MGKKKLKSFEIPSGFFLLGLLFLIIGGSGEQNAINFSGINAGGSWTTSESLINAFIFIPIIIGISFLLLAISTFSILFYFQQKNASL
ncbi:hypothetical protein [Sporosarcina sp. YIM B06819]|uniref:hypothetical protein n=1 Tax=Sporosarcina sp. YIM B06819 TaxID=3081769 RepID=UPI00298D134D|nr:hypothetical protein [Sporosarcina sp. YIM B06819]